MLTDESFNAFARQHGNYVNLGDVTIFEDGASFCYARDGLPVFREPSADPDQVLRLRRRYAEVTRRPEVEPFHAFSERHGGDPVYVGGQFLFPDGARCDRSRQFRIEPPAEPAASLRAQKWYFEAKLKQEVDEFVAFYAECVERANHVAQGMNCCPPVSNAVEQLQRGQERINDLQAELKEIEKEWKKTPEGRAERSRQKLERERRRRAQGQLNAIHSITIDLQ